MLDGPQTQEPWLRNLRSVASDGGALWSQARKIFYVYDETLK
jgi:hypothetical protein